MTDNGTAAGVHFKEGWPDGHTVVRGFNAGMRGQKTSSYDGGHRVPCFIRWPAGGLEGGKDVEQLSAHVDILPTLVDLCGLGAGKNVPGTSSFDGLSLEPLLTGTGAAIEDRVLIESFNHVVITKRWRLVRGSELYDMQADPGQQTDVAGQHPEVVARLKKRLEEYRETEDRRDHLVAIGADEENPVMLTAEHWPKAMMDGNERKIIAQIRGQGKGEGEIQIAN